MLRITNRLTNFIFTKAFLKILNQNNYFFIVHGHFINTVLSLELEKVLIDLSIKKISPPLKLLKRIFENTSLKFLFSGPTIIFYGNDFKSLLMLSKNKIFQEICLPLAFFDKKYVVDWNFFNNYNVQINIQLVLIGFFISFIYKFLSFFKFYFSTLYRQFDLFKMKALC